MDGAGESIVVNLLVFSPAQPTVNPTPAVRPACQQLRNPGSLFLNAFDQPLKRYQVVASTNRVVRVIRG
jgi:hypothetical protein